MSWYIESYGATSRCLSKHVLLVIPWIEARKTNIFGDVGLQKFIYTPPYTLMIATSLFDRGEL